MEVSDCTKIVLDRIQNIEPEIATKIIGYLLLNHTNDEIMEYAFGSDEQIHSLVNDAKLYLASSPKPVVSSLIQPGQYLPSQAFSRTFSSPSSFRVPAPYSSPHNSPDFLPSSYNHLSRALSERRELAALEEQLHGLNPLGLDFSSNYFGGDFGGGLGSRASGLRSPTGLPEFPKACHYFYKGYCRHGNYCKFFHGQPAADNFLQMYGLSPNELLNDDHLFSRLSLEQLEVEISELLKARNGMPVSIASLPSMYLEMYGKTLQADGYLTESQRHGKVGFSLTRLLARLNRIRLIDRPHGQHAVVLAEDAPKYEYRNERNDPGLSSSHQIYLTFPAESSFTDEDVAKYFEQFGPVRDVRIPRQEKRMFGFVSFMYPQTVREILAKGHPHIIRGSRVLVKPYKEKAKCWDRTFTQRAGFPMCYPQCFEMEPELPTSLSVPQGYGTASFLKTQLIEEQENALELERRRLIELQLNTKQLASHSFFNYGMEQLKSPADRFSTLPVQDNGCSSDDKPQQTEHNCSAQDSSHIELPDSPFASPRLGNII